MEDRQRSMADKSDQEEVFAPGSAIDSNLKQLAERRTDIFGIGTEETQIGKKVCDRMISQPFFLSRTVKQVMETYKHTCLFCRRVFLRPVNLNVMYVSFLKIKFNVFTFLVYCIG